MSFRFSKLFLPATFVLLAFSHTANAGAIKEPRLYDDSDYNEYWEQQFLFDNGTMVTSQFLIANFPFSKQHGLMVATLKKPENDAIIVKNGRKRDGWNFDETKPRLSIFQHELSGDHPGYFVRLNNTAAEVDVLYTSREKSIPLIRAGNPFGLPEVSLYAPAARAEGRWRAGPEIGGAGEDGDWEQLGTGGGYGLHVVQRTSLNHSIRRWQRFTAFASDAQYAPILHAFETPSGDKQSTLIILNQGSEPIRFDNITLTQANSGTSWELTAQTEGATLSGIIKSKDNIENFQLKDHLNHLEQMVAGSLADISRHRFTAHYDLTLTVNGKVSDLNGTALAENIVLGEEKKRKRRSRR